MKPAHLLNRRSYRPSDNAAQYAESIKASHGQRRSEHRKKNAAACSFLVFAARRRIIEIVRTALRIDPIHLGTSFRSVDRIRRRLHLGLARCPEHDVEAGDDDRDDEYGHDEAAHAGFRFSFRVSHARKTSTA